MLCTFWSWKQSCLYPKSAKNISKLVGKDKSFRFLIKLNWCSNTRLNEPCKVKTGLKNVKNIINQVLKAGSMTGGSKESCRSFLLTKLRLPCVFQLSPLCGHLKKTCSFMDLKALCDLCDFKILTDGSRKVKSAVCFELWRDYCSLGTCTNLCSSSESEYRRLHSVSRSAKHGQRKWVSAAFLWINFPNPVSSSYAHI